MTQLPEHRARLRFRAAARRVLAAAVLLLCAGAASRDAQGRDIEVVHRERSLYQTILITRGERAGWRGDVLCMQFTMRDRERHQSCVDPARPKRMVFTYTRMAMAALLLNPQPDSILVAGLGGGTLPDALADLLPEARIDVVEVDPAVVRAAQRHFGFRESERMRVHVADARVFAKRALARGARYDLLILDAYGGDYIPEHLMTAEFLAECRALLAPGGVLAANTFASSRLYDHESETYRAVFGAFFNFRRADSGNRIVLAQRGAPPSKAVMRERAETWAKPLRPYAVPIRQYPDALSPTIDWDTSKRPLTDQYAPANLLRGG